ncbi:MAG: undecaprenyldiphospho-muramoylpentapeptide beta-N-acetylglucosaminyltransferase [Actinomycetota bacterium]|nr:undecaprenyldiphospho-muramoylpentapeptide beta-N-acetylglucosaminyltransferase [Actinomycetota bacterium]
MKVVISGGGTVGHVNPAVALGRALSEDEVTFIGTSRGVEARIVPAARFPFETIEVQGFDRAKPASLVRVGVTALKATGRARRLLRTLSPDAVVGMGGYVALPVCFAARSLRIPVVVHEQNIVLGLTNRLCKRFARRVAVSFEETLAEAGRRGVDTGNPVLPEIAEMDVDVERKKAIDRFDLDPDRRTLLVFGGSQGAQRINGLVPHLVELWRDKRDRQIVHISGSAQPAAEPGGESELIYRTTSYVESMSEMYAVADIALCRGGATTIAELTAVGVPGVIVPYPYHRDRQQELHGRALERVGAATVLMERDATALAVDEIAGPLLDDVKRLDGMRAAAKSFGRPEAARQLAAVVREVAA